MAEGLTFANYALNQDGIDEIYTIGTGDGNGTGVIEEMATAFGYELTETPTVDNLGTLIGVVGKSKELQDNIAGVQEVLGTDEDAVAITRGWAERSGLLVPVERSYVTAELMDGPIDLAVISGGVRNWMARRLARLEELHKTVGVNQAVLVAGNRPMKTTEGSDVEEGMVEYDYMRQVMMQQVVNLGISSMLVEAQTGNGDEVMNAGAEAINRRGLVDLYSGRLAVVSNAGAWVQNTGQFRRAVRALVNPDFDREGDQLLAVSDSFPLGTGTEPTATHQNPFTAAGQIVRNAQELARYTH